VESVREPRGAGAWTVARGSPADSAGVRAGDLIVSIDGQPLEHFLPAMLCVISRPVGTRFKLGFIRPSSGAGDRPAIQTVEVLSAPRPIDPPLPPLDIFEKLTGIRLAMMPGGQGEPGGLRIASIASDGGGPPRRITIGSRLVAMLPGTGLIEALEEGKTDQEVKIGTVEDLGSALRASSDGARLAAVLIWSTGGVLDTMVLSGEAKQYPLL
jgi:hypothetical protein